MATKTKDKSADAETSAAQDKDQEAAKTSAKQTEETPQKASAPATPEAPKEAPQEAPKASKPKEGPATLLVEITATKVHVNGRFRARGERVEMTRRQIERVRDFVKPVKD